MKNKNYVVLYSFCKLVKGDDGCCIYDLRKGIIHTIPASYAALFFNDYYIDQEAMKSKLRIQDNSKFEAFLSFLVNHDLVFVTNEIECFPLMNMQFSSPYLILKSLIYIDKKNLKKIIETVHILMDHGLQHLDLLTEGMDLKDLKLFLKSISFRKLREINLIVESKKYVNEYKQWFINDRKRYSFVFSLTFVFVDENQDLDLISDVGNYVIRHINANSYLHSIESKRSCLKIISKEFFIESHSFHPFYNQSIVIDKVGDIKNDMRQNENFGNIYLDNVIDVICSEDFQALWKVSSDDLVPVNRSAFRFSFLSLDLPIKNKNNEYEILLDVYEFETLFKPRA